MVAGEGDNGRGGMTPEDLERWLNARPAKTWHQEAVWIAFRAAARVLPVVWGEYGKRTTDFDVTVWQSCRCLLISGVAAYVPTPDIRVTDAAAAAYAATAAATAAAAYAATAAAAAAAAYAAAYAATATAADATAAAYAAVTDAYYAYAAAAATTAADAAFLGEHGPGDAMPGLWLNPMPEDIATKWNAVIPALAQAKEADPRDDWSFWIDWYQALLDGRPQNLGMLTEIALIDPTDWDKGPAHVNPMINKIVARYAREGQGVVASLAALPPATDAKVQATKTAMERHRKELPATLDAILGYVSLEIERLQTKNHRSDEEVEEAARQIRVLTTIYQAVVQLALLVPSEPEMPIEDAEMAEKLGRLYLNKFRVWPRNNADEMVDNTYRFALVGLTSFAATMVGIPAMYAFPVGMTVFATTKMIEKARAAQGLAGDRHGNPGETS